LFFSTLPAAAEGPIPFKELARNGGIDPAISASNPMDSQSAPSDRPGTANHQRHWTKGGKIMTYIGVGLMAGGGGALAYGLSKKDNYCYGSCFAFDWKWTGAAWLGAGSVLTAIGATRRSQ
jgi:hypothetical protein